MVQATKRKKKLFKLNKIEMISSNDFVDSITVITSALLVFLWFVIFRFPQVRCPVMAINLKPKSRFRVRDWFLQYW